MAYPLSDQESCGPGCIEETNLSNRRPQNWPQSPESGRPPVDSGNARMWPESHRTKNRSDFQLPYTARACSAVMVL